MPDKLNLSEHVETLFEGVEGVTEEQKQKMETVLEAAVSSVVLAETAKIQEAADAQVVELVEAKTQELETTLSKYLDYVISEWMEENRLAVTNGLQLEMAQNFMNGMKSLFTEHNVSVPEGAEDLVAAHEAKIAELEVRLNESTAKLIDATSELNEHARANVISKLAEGLSDTQKAKFDSLVEGIEFKNVESFETKVKTIRESYFKNAVEAEASAVALKEQANSSHSGNPANDRLSRLLNPYR